jgi:hypothetical protein
MILGVEPTSGTSKADVRAGRTLNGVGVGLLCRMTIVDGMPPPVDNSGACPMVQGMEEGDIIAKMRTGVVPVLTEVQEDALKVMERMEVMEHVEIVAIVEVVAIMVVTAVIMEVTAVIVEVTAVIVEVVEIVEVVAIVKVIGKTMTHEIHIYHI